MTSFLGHIFEIALKEPLLKMVYGDRLPAFREQWKAAEQQGSTLREMDHILKHRGLARTIEVIGQVNLGDALAKQVMLRNCDPSALTKELQRK